METATLPSVSPPGKAEREQMLEMLLSELDGMAYRCRVDAQWTMEFVSEGCAALTGYQPEELLHNSAISFEALTHPEDRARVRDTVHRAIDEGRGYSLEYRIRARGGEIKWVWERGRRLPPRDGRPPMVHGFIQDISTLIAQRQALASAEQRYRSIFENANEGIFQTTEDGHYLEVNPALAAIYGYASPTALVAALVNISRQLYVEPARREEFVRLMREQGRVSNFESRVYRRDGSIIWISENAHAVKAADGSLLYYEGTVEDITARKSYEEQISWQATHDSLTELPNRILLTERIQATIRHADRHEGSFAVVFLDLDHFKNVNDTFGHAGGDQLIRKIAARLRACLREGDTVARLGGDEFVLLLPDIHRQAESLGLLLQRVLSTVRQPCRLGEREYPVSCSIGISIYPDDGRDAQTLLKHADIAMYQAKESGRDNFQFFSEEFNRLVVENVELEHALRAGLQRAEFELYFQPIFDMAGERVLKAEALLRWNPRGGMVSPSRFIPIAERSGLIDLLGDWVLERVVRQQREWCERGLPVVPLSLNISPRQFLQPDLVDSLAAALQRHDLPARLLEIEITENCLARDRQRFLRCLEEIKSLGIGIALDDFGSGYSNMESLKAMHFDSLKIDRSFITEVENGKNHQAIYRAIVSLAHNLHMTVVAEGVETRGQIDFLRGIPCDAVQGFYYSRPLPAAAFESLLALEQPPLQTSA